MLPAESTALNVPAVVMFSAATTTIVALTGTFAVTVTASVFGLPLELAVPMAVYPVPLPAAAYGPANGPPDARPATPAGTSRSFRVSLNARERSRRP